MVASGAGGLRRPIFVLIAILPRGEGGALAGHRPIGRLRRRAACGLAQAILDAAGLAPPASDILATLVATVAVVVVVLPLRERGRPVWRCCLVAVRGSAVAVYVGLAAALDIAGLRSAFGERMRRGKRSDPAVLALEETID